MPILNMVEAINLALKQEMQKDKSVIVCGEDVARNGGVFRVTDKLAELYDGRCFDTPLAESGIIGTAMGMAAFGMKPVVEIQFEGFISLGFDQILNNVSRLRNRSRGRFHVPMVIRSPYTGGVKAFEHHSESIEAFYAHIPGIKVVSPSSPYAAKGLLISAIRDPDPVLFLEPKRVYRAIKEEVPDEEYTIPLGKARVLQEGSDLTIITYGAMVRDVQKAIEQSNINCSIELIDLQSLSPIDKPTIIQSVKKTGRAIIVNEAPRSGSLASEIMAILMEECLYDLEAPVMRVTGYDTVMPYAKLEQFYIPSAARILQAIKQVMG